MLWISDRRWRIPVTAWEIRACKGVNLQTVTPLAAEETSTYLENQFNAFLFLFFFFSFVWRPLASNNGSQSGVEGPGLQAAGPHWSFRQQIHAAWHLTYVHLRADVHQAHSVDSVLPGLRGRAGHGVRGPRAVLLSVPPRHQAGRGGGSDDGFPLHHLLQPQLFPLQQGDAKWPVPCRGAACFAQRQVCISVHFKGILVWTRTGHPGTKAASDSFLCHRVESKSSFHHTQKDEDDDDDDDIKTCLKEFHLWA